MNHEEKILALLETMSDRQTKTEVLLAEMRVETNTRFDRIENRLERVDERLELVENRLERVDGRLELVENRLENLEERIDRVEDRIEGVEETVMRIENDHGMKLSVLADGYTQLADQYTRLNDRLTTQEEFVLRRVFAK